MIVKSINTPHNAPLYIENENGVEIKQGEYIGKKVIPIAEFVDDENEHLAIGVYDWQFEEPQVIESEGVIEEEE